MKRKSSKPPGGKAKRIKLTNDSDSLAWKPLKLPSHSHSSEGFEGLLECEELDGVEVVKEDGIVKFKVAERSDSDTEEEEAENESREAASEDENFGELPTLEHWSFASNLHPRLLHSLHSRKFDRPTPIQEKILTLALESDNDRDIVGIANTGSGKTLAYGLPILHSILVSKRRKGISALVLTPTRELAIQVSKHLTDALTIQGSTSAKLPLSIFALTGGLSSQKQSRILHADRGVDVLVATPGRLWEFMQSDSGLVKSLQKIFHMVLDEADKLVQKGRGYEKEVAGIIDLVLKRQVHTTDEEFLETDVPTEVPNPDDVTSKPRTYIFSATMSPGLMVNLRRKKGGIKPRTVSSSNLEDLLESVQLNDPHIVDLTSTESDSLSSGPAESVPTKLSETPTEDGKPKLVESVVECVSSEKDLYLLLFHTIYPGRTLVFFNSVGGVRRVGGWATHLGLQTFSLHSQMEQKQRMKNLERFKTTKSSLLLSTDLSARGLDIQNVDHVLHWDVPGSVDAYIHRNGRTARAHEKGFACVFVTPEEARVWRGIMGAVRKGAPALPVFLLPTSIFAQLKPRLALAKKLDGALHKMTKENHEKKWEKEARDALGLESDNEELDTDGHTNRQRKKRNAEIAQMKAELKDMCSRRLVAPGTMQSYVTSGVTPAVQAAAGLGIEEVGSMPLLGIGVGDARSGVKVKGAKALRSAGGKGGKKVKSSRRNPKEEGSQSGDGLEEWGGIGT